MMGEPNTVMLQREQPSLTDKITTLAAWGVAGGLFLTVGWMAFAPADPVGPVSLFAMRHGMLGWLQAIAIAVVSGGLATVIAGRRVVDVGPLAVALGLMSVSFRGGTAGYFLLHGVESVRSGQGAVAAEFAVESVAWLIVLFAATLASAAVLRWCFNEPAAARPGETGREGHSFGRFAAGFDIPRVSAHLFGIAPSALTPVLDGIKHSLIAVGLALASFGLLSGGLAARTIQHGQACFVTGAAVFIGVYAATRLVPVRSASWSLLSVGVIAVAGYGWSAFRHTTSLAPPTVPVSCFMRVLPIQLIGVGAAAAITAFGWATEHEPIDGPAPHGSRRST